MSIITDIQEDFDKAALEVVSKYHGRLFLEAVKLCGNETDAEDLVMRTFDTVFRTRETYDAKKGGLFPWMVGVMRRVWAKTDRRIVDRRTDPVDPDVIVQLAGVSHKSEEEILRNSDYDALREAIKQLDPTSRKLIGLYYYDDLSLKEIASFFKTSPSSISRKLAVARRILAAKLTVKVKRNKHLAVFLCALLVGGALFGAWQILGTFLGTDPENTATDEEFESGKLSEEDASEDFAFYDLFDDLKPPQTQSSKVTQAASNDIASAGDRADASHETCGEKTAFSFFSVPAEAVQAGNIITNGGFEHTTATANTAGFVDFDTDKFWHSCKISDAVGGTWTEYNSSRDYRGAGFRKKGRDGTGSWAAYLAALHQAKESSVQRDQGVYIYCEVELKKGNYFFEYWIKRVRMRASKGFVNVDFEKKDDASVKGRIASGSLAKARSYTRVTNPSFRIPEDGSYRIVFSLWWDAQNFEIPECPSLAAYIDDVAMYRLSDDVGGAIKVSGDPNDYGSPNPQYGFVEFPKVGDEKTLLAPADVCTSNVWAHCVGYELRDVNGAFVLDAQGEPMTGSVGKVALKFTPAMQNATLSWLFEVSNRIEVASVEYGTVQGLREESPGCGWGWYRYGEDVVLQAKPKYHLLGWKGVPDYGVIDTTYSFKAVEPTTVTPVFASTRRDNLILNGDFEDLKPFRCGYSHSYNFISLNSGAWFGSKRVEGEYPSLGIFSSHLELTPIAGDYAAYLNMSRLYEEVQSPGVCMWCRVAITEPGVYAFSCELVNTYEANVKKQHPYVISATLIKGTTVTPQSEGVVLVSREVSSAHPPIWETLENRDIVIKEPGDYVIKFGLSGWDTKSYRRCSVGAGIDNVVLKFRKGLGSGTMIMVR